MNDNQTKREAGTGDIVEAVRHVRILLLELLPMEFRWLPPGRKKMGFRKLFIVAFAMLAAVTLHGCGCDESELASCATSGVSAGCCEEWSEAGGDVISGLADCNNACD